MLALVTLGGLVFFGSLAYLLFVQQQMRQLEGLLERDLMRIQSLIQRPEIGERFVDTGGTDFVLQFVSNEGQVVLPLNAEGTLPLRSQPTVDRFGDVPLLLSSLPWVSASGAERGTIRLALDLRDAFAARRNLLRSLLVSGGLIALLAVAVGLLLLRRSLAPLVSLAFRARKVDPANPRSVPHVGPPDEVADMAHALNIALDGIRSRQEAERASLAEIAHELAAPLTLVAGHLESLAARSPDARLLAARDAAAELLYTSQDLLTLARGELETPLELEIFDLVGVAKRVAAEYPGVQVNGPARAEMAGNPQRLAQLVRNLVRNAVQASGGAEAVSLVLHAEGGQLVLEVTDEGTGIAPEDLPHVFERFYTRRGGVGVGLGVARRIARQHGGDILVASEPGRGSRFTVVLEALEERLEPVGD